jgi:inorganic pyrophosphatase
MKFPKAYSKKKDLVNVIIETPYKSRNKFDYDKKTGLFKFSKVIPIGMEFPCDMGFIPHTKGEDGDPLDALIFMDELTYPGCLVECRLLGVIKLTQKEKGKTKERNDRFIFVPENMEEYMRLKSVKDLNKVKLIELADFLQNYGKKESKMVEILEIADHAEAHGLIKKQMK